MSTDCIDWGISITQVGVHSNGGIVIARIVWSSWMYVPISLYMYEIPIDQNVFYGVFLLLRANKFAYL